MTKDTSPENLRKFLKSDDPALVRMGLSMAKGAGVPDDLLGEILWMYMFHDGKTIRAAAKSTFIKLAPEDAKQAVKENWEANYRQILRLGTRLGTLAKSLNQTSLSLVEPLIKALGNKDRAGFELLARGGRRRREPQQHADCPVRSDAAEALGEIGDARAVEPLIEALRNACNGAAEALDKLGWEPDTDELRAAYFVSRSNFSECVKIGEPAVKPLIEALLPSPSLGVGQSIHRISTAAKALGKIGDERAVEPLIKTLESEYGNGYDGYVADDAAEALRKFGIQGLQGFITAGKGGGLTVSELKTILKEKKLPTSGKKKDLIERLKEAE